MSNVLVDLDDLADDTAFYVSQVCTPLITCKNCKHNGTMRCKCFMCDGNEYMSYKNPNFYCADAERKE